jgi:hypothetical protein
MLESFYHPKGMMCASCKDKFKKCDQLNFSKMPPVEKRVDEGVVIVKVICTEYKYDKHD